MTKLNYTPDYCQFYILSSFLCFDTKFLITKSQNPYLLPAGHKTSRKGNQKVTWPQTSKADQAHSSYLICKPGDQGSQAKLFTSRPRNMHLFFLLFS